MVRQPKCLSWILKWNRAQRKEYDDLYTYVCINAAGMHAGLFEHMHAASSHHQISWVYLTGLSAQSDLIFLVDLSVLGYGELYLLVNFFPGLFFFFYTI